MIIFFIKNNKVFLNCMLVAALLFSLFYYDASQIYKADETLAMYSRAYALTDGDTGRVLLGKNETEPMANASTTKILTCIVALEQKNLTDSVEISVKAASQPKVRLGVKAGESYPLKDLLYALMLESYNDCAVAIAEHVAGSVEEFARLLNMKALEIGCDNTYFITSNGLDAEAEGDFHHSTARDLCKIMAYCVWKSPQSEMFLEISQTRNYTGTSNGKCYTFVNRNSFLEQMDACLSGKTGYTAKAGYCYVAAIEEEGEKYCIALLACGWPNNKNYRWKDAAKLFQYGMESYSKESILGKHIEKEIEINGCVGEYDFENINRPGRLIAVGDSIDITVLMNAEDKLREEIEIYRDITLPIEQEQALGEYRVYLDEVLLNRVTLHAQMDCSPWGWKKILESILLKFVSFFLNVYCK